MGLKLFDDGGSDSDDGAGDLSKIEINQEFARRYEHNKKREDLQRFEELKKKGVIDSDNDSEDDDESSEDEENIVNYSSKQDVEFFDALIKVRNQDPSLKNKDAKLFDSDNEDEDDDEADDNKEKKKKPMYLKDVTAKHLIEKGPEFDDEDDEEENKDKKKSYFEEQDLLRKEFLDAVGDEDDEGDILKVKDNKRGVEDEDEDGDEVEFEKKLDEYFQEDEKLDENEKFLKDYFRKKMWLDKESGSKRLNDDDLDVSEDEEELERQEDYEREFNFRFEENAGDRVMGFSRKVDGSVRKKDNARKIQRKNKEERIAQAEFERTEELKHMKNLKKKEMNEKLKKIRETAGIGENEVCLLDEHDLEEEFDPDEYDKKMKKAFDDNFYEAEDVDPEFGSDEEDGDLKKPNFDEEDEFLGLPKGWEDKYKSGDGFLATRERTLKGKSDISQPQDEDETVSEEDKKKKRKRSELEKEVINKELEEYYKLDYEDTIGDLKTRFKYRPVNKNTYGLKAKEILVVDDKELNQLVPLKKLATYREEEFIVPHRKIKEHKQRIKSLLKGETSEGVNNGRKKEKSSEMVDAESKKTENEEDGKVLSRKQRRKKKMNESKLPLSRLVAYQKIPVKSSKKKKHKA